MAKLVMIFFLSLSSFVSFVAVFEVVVDTVFVFVLAIFYFFAASDFRETSFSITGVFGSLMIGAG